MTSSRLIVGPFSHLVKTGDFLTWLETRFARMLLREDYWSPELLSLSIAEAVPNIALDRNEILLLPRGLGPYGACSISWSMPLTLVQVGDTPRIHLFRGYSHCAVCELHDEREGAIFCRHYGPPSMGPARAYDRDSGYCPLFVSETSPAQVHYTTEDMPVWWRDSDWCVAAWRYQNQAFDPTLLERWLRGKFDGGPFRHPTIPLAGYERAARAKARAAGKTWQRAASPSKAGWMAFLKKHLTQGRDGHEEWIQSALAMCRCRAFDAGGTMTGEIV